MEYSCSKCNAIYDIEIIKAVDQQQIKYDCLFCGKNIIENSDNNKPVFKNIIKYPDTKIALPGTINLLLNDYLKQYESYFDSLSINGINNHGHEMLPEDGWKYLELTGEKRSENGTTGIYLKVFFLHDCKQVQIPNILVPYFLKHKGIGKKMISIVYSVCKQFNYELFIVDMVDGFYRKLLARGAVQIDLDSVEITDDTNLEQ